MTREFTFERATKNTYRYQEIVNEGGEPQLSQAVYIYKTALPTKPQRIRVTVEEVQVTT